MKRFLAVLVAAVTMLVLATGCSGSVPAIPTEAVSALQDAAECADELGARYEGFANTAKADKAAGGAGDGLSGTSRSFDTASKEIGGAMARVQADIDVVESTEGAWTGREQAVAAMQNLQGLLNYERDILEAQHKAANAPEGSKGVPATLLILYALSDEYEAITPPDCLKQYMQNTIDTLPTVTAALSYTLAAPDSTLSQHTTDELLTWWLTKQSAYDAECDRIMVRQCKASSDMLRSIAEGTSATPKPTVSIQAIDEIAPNLYPSLDAVANVGITSSDDAHAVQVEVEVAGFSQKFEQKYDLAQGYNYLPIKPALLPQKDLPNLVSNAATQLNVKVTDATSGEVLAQESHPMELLSMYDFCWTDDEFGKTAAFDILAWLRPQADEVTALNRAAADVLGGWKGGAYKTVDGYQHGTDVQATLYQAMAIQQAISDAGVTYVMDSYSFMSDQHILTPDVVMQKRRGLCIETSLLMASCLMSAGMHPLIIVTPTHAQVAVETFQNSGNYFLLETTTLPFGGPNTSTADTDPAFYNGFLAGSKDASGVRYWTTTGSSDEWKAYFDAVGNSFSEYNGIFVIDCQLQQIMGIQGLENI